MNLLFSSFHNYLDLTSGAAISARAVMRELARNGWNVRTRCGSFFDDPTTTERSFLFQLAKMGLRYEIRSFQIRVDERVVTFREIAFNDGGIESVAVFIDEKGAAFYEPYSPTVASAKIFYKRLLDEMKERVPDVYLSYGGYASSRTGAHYARKLGATTVFYLCNLSYRDKRLWNEYDATITPSTYCRDYYRAKLGIDSIVLPPLIDESSVLIDANTREFTTFVNPSPEKGVSFFIGLARDLQSRRPDVPLLVVDSRADASLLGRFKESKLLTNLNSMASVARPQTFYRRSRIVLIPSLCEEAFCRVAVEASFNRIPVLASNRGALPSVLSGESDVSDVLLNIPDRITPRNGVVPSSEETREWLAALEKIWDDDSRARAVGDRLERNTRKYRFENVARETIDVFEKLARKEY